MILAAGKGTRMGSLTRNLPKPMLPVNEKPILEHIIRHLAEHGIRKIVINVHYLPQKIMEYFEDGRRWGVTILYSHEPQLMDTGGGVATARPFFEGEPLLLVNGDVLCDVTPQQLFAAHLLQEAWVTLTVIPSRNYQEYGLVVFNDSLDVVAILPKGEPPPPGMHSGIYSGHAFLHPGVVKLLKPVPRSIVTMLFKPLIARGKIKAYPFKGQWIDFGTSEKYTQVTNNKF